MPKVYKLKIIFFPRWLSVRIYWTKGFKRVLTVRTPFLDTLVLWLFELAALLLVMKSWKEEEKLALPLNRKLIKIWIKGNKIDYTRWGVEVNEKLKRLNMNIKVISRKFTVFFASLEFKVKYEIFLYNSQTFMYVSNTWI